MLTKRIIPCLDVKDGQVVKGIQFREHKVVGDIISLAEHYSDDLADELVFYDITASTEGRTVSVEWVRSVARVINIPFCVAGGIRSVQEAECILKAGADKISINSPAIENPDLINQLVSAFGRQSVVVGVDSFCLEGQYFVYQYTGDVHKMQRTELLTGQWIKEIQDRGAGEIVLNCMNVDGMRKGYDLVQLKEMRSITHVPLIASGGAGECQHFYAAFADVGVDGALAASVFHSKKMSITGLKEFLNENNIRVRL